MKLLPCAVLLLGALDCAKSSGPVGPYVPTRQDYAAFAAAWPELLEPNYLPFVLHRTESGSPEGDLLFFCRWPDEAMPLAVHIVRPEIPDALQDEFSPREPSDYPAAVKKALSTWEGHLEGLVSFRVVEDPSEARLTVRLLGERAPEPEPDLRVLGSTRLEGACRVKGRDPDAERLEVAFEVEELRLFLADEFGLLSPGQVEWTALHEIGHALGMRGHSPIPADLMFEVARDRVSVNEGLSPEDVNSFVSLYRIPNGTLFGRAAEGERQLSSPGPGPAKLAIAPHVDTRLGFEYRPPAGWMRVPTAQGMAAVDGTTWDYTASLQVVVQRYPTVQAYLDRFGAYYAQRGQLTEPSEIEVAGRRALQVEIDRFDAPRVEQITLVEVGDGRLLIVIGDCPRDAIDAYRPWFQAAVASMKLTELPDEAWPRARGAR